jgi:hypothetical protein
MGKFSIVLLVIVFLLCGCAVVPDSEVVNTLPTLDMESAPIPTPTAEPTPQPTAAPTPFIYNGINAFLGDPEQFIWQNFLLLPGMNTIANNKDLFSDKGLMPAAMLYNEFDVFGDTGNVILDGTSYYSIVLPVDQKKWNLDKLADVFGNALGLEYITKYVNNPEVQFAYKHAQGSDDHYFDSAIHFDSIMAGEGYCSFATQYYDISEVFTSLADECFSSDRISVPEVMDVKQSSVGIEMFKNPEGHSTIRISKMWIGLSKDEGKAVKRWLKENGYEVTIEYSKDRIEYMLTLEDAYYKSIFVDVFDIGSVYGTDKKANHLVTFKIELNR